MSSFDNKDLLIRILKYEQTHIVRVPLEDQYEKADDQQLLEWLQSGSRSQKGKAVTALVNRYGEFVLTRLIGRGLAYEEAQDISQEVWLIGLKRFEKDFEWQGVPLKGFLSRTADNLANAHFRIMKEERGHEAELHLHIEAITYLNSKLNPDHKSPPPEPSEAAKEKSNQLLIEALKSVKNDKHKRVIQLIYWKGLNSRQVAKELGMTHVAVRVAHTRTLKKIKNYLTKREVS